MTKGKWAEKIKQIYYGNLIDSGALIRLFERNMALKTIEISASKVYIHFTSQSRWPQLSQLVAIIRSSLKWGTVTVVIRVGHLEGSCKLKH